MLQHDSSRQGIVGSSVCGGGVASCGWWFPLENQGRGRGERLVQVIRVSQV